MAGTLRADVYSLRVIRIANILDLFAFVVVKKKEKHTDFVVDSIAKMPKNLVLNMESIKRA